MSASQLEPERADALGLRTLIRVAETDAHEGPVYATDEDALYFTSAPPGAAIKRLALDGDSLTRGPRDVSVVRADANAPNGMALNADGRLVVCEQGSSSEPARIALVDRSTGGRQTLVDGWSGLPLNSPNDVVVKRDGSVWFTDPSYGFLQGFRAAPMLADAVYRHDPRTAATTVAADAFDKPNGLAFSPDERVLYVGDSGANHEPGSYDPARPHHVEAFDVVAGTRLTNRRLFAVITPGFPDGIKVDRAGRVYVSAFSGVQVFAPDGRPLGEIPLPGAVNFTWGGRDGDVLFITADTAIWAAVFDMPPTRSQEA